MTIEKTWSANSVPQPAEEGEELINLAGRWNIGIEVSITKPYTYLQGPIEKRLMGTEIQDMVTIHLPHTE